jgi:hypothetical protein
MRLKALQIKGILYFHPILKISPANIRWPARIALKTQSQDKIVLGGVLKESTGSEADFNQPP